MFKIGKYLDFNLLIVILLLITIGVVMIASATDADTLGITREVKFQLISFGLGVIAMVIVMLIDYQLMGDLYLFVYALSIIALLLVYVPGLGVEQAGARSWIDLGLMDFQTSEIAKIGFIVSFAKLLEKREGRLENLFDIFIPILFVLPLLLLIFKQPDLGSMLVFVFIFLGMIFVSGLNIKIILLSALSAVLSLPLVYTFLEPHQKQRIDAFLNPNDASLPGNYHVLMSKITIGSGKLKGNGLFQGGFSANNFLPVQETDFIFAVLVEELGFIGGIAVIGLYFLFLSRLIRIAFKAKDHLGNNIVVGVLFMFAFQIFENIGMTMGIMPVTGVTLPFLSYGGSSMIVNMIAIGLVMNVYMRRKRKSYDMP
ncbi:MULTISPECIES: rod shape-determining protein RodA [unclassified Fusibacter]|uniref:rod shape-determining protein RodA n=1 Tax=unclassified Fusibacter TaxID=2624464 RepID=UPI0010111BF8|nr:MULTISPECIES: rod shape-determining protein RodA [unclassified Fusibacter]MCK8060675.1 rod shape-determining protein RodA [Fusibacter sp. A2]NPE22871.1 rod shape-determining protein RodA [Fusibacter sp. A1]RXV59940.1 rod shape-determining protein RodA [Fusibacter sp. A1]